MADGLSRWSEILQLFEQPGLPSRERLARLKHAVEPVREDLANDREFIQAICGKLRNQNFRVRALAAEALAMLACPDVVEPLLRAGSYRETSAEVRRKVESAVMALPLTCMPKLLDSIGDGRA